LRGNYFLKHVIEEKIQWTKSQGRRRKQQLNNLKETKGHLKLKEEELDRSVSSSRFGKG
jgi:hypothetical protein